MSCKRVILWFLGTVLILSWSTSLNAQLNRGVLEGTVTDPQGAVVPGVDVTISSVDTNVAQSTKTNSAGYYRAVDLVPGKYRAHFSSSGFTAVDITDIEVSAGEVIKIDAQLKLGATREQVQVTAEVPLLETSASNFSTSLEARTVREVPLQGRDIQQLVFLVPGVNPVGGPPGANFGFNSQFGTFPDPTHALGSDLSVNGGQGGANAWYLDGNINLSSFAENVAVNPVIDAVSEFQAITNAFSAEYGRTGGAVFNVVLKSGTNNLHGNIYEFVRNDATNARNPFTSIDSAGKIIKNPLRFNNFGGTLGGPVYVPHLYEGRNKTFFFVSWDTNILHRLGSRTYTVPTRLMRQGNFSEDPSVAQFGIWNPYTTVGPTTVNGTSGLFLRTAFGTPAPGNPFGANGCLNSSVEAGAAMNPPVTTCNFSAQLPVGSLDPTAMYFINSFPSPNYNDPLSSCPLDATGLFKICDNFRGPIASSQDTNYLSLKIDHQWSEKSKYFAEWLFNPGKYQNYRVPWKGPTFPQDNVGFGAQYNVDFASQIIALGNTYMVSPTLINEFRGSFSRQFMTTHPSHPYPDSITAQSQVQQILTPLRIPEDPFFPVPNWTMSTPGGGNIAFGPTTWVNMNTAAEAYTILDNVTRVMGKHTLKTGFIYRLEHTAYESGFPTGFGFGGEQVVDPNTSLGGGAGLAQFMLGAVATGGRGSFTGVMWKPYERFRYWGLYLQDDFRINPKFTVNFGVRYELNGYFQTRQRPNSNFCLGCPNATTGLLGKVIYEGDPEWPGQGKDIAPPNYTSIAPRFNFSWTPFANKKTVIRGGYDVFYTNALASINSPGQSAANAPGWNQEYDWNGSFYPNQCAPFSGECVAFPLSDTTTDKRTLTTPQLPSSFPAQNKAPMLGIGLLQFFTPPSHDPMMESWGLEVERELPGNMMIDIGYVGSHGTHLVGEAFRQYNYVHTADKLRWKTALGDEVPISNYYSGKTAALLAQVYNAGTDASGNFVLPRSLLLKPYPFYGALSVLQNNTAFDGASIYHGMNLRVQKRFSRGLDFIAAYTVSKKIANAETGQLATMLVDPIHWARNGQLGGRAGALAWNGGFGGSFQDLDNKKADRAVAADDVPQILNIAATYELPFGNGRQFLNHPGALNHLVGGWVLTGNFNAESGLPVFVSCPGNQITSRCNLIGDPHFSGNRSKADRIADWINPAAFQPPFGPNDAQNFWANYNAADPRAYQFGAEGARLPNFRYPGFWNVDTKLAKEFHFSESRYFEFRWEVYNMLNHQNLGLPNDGFPSFCLPPLANGNTDLVHQAGCQFGRITNVQTDPRAMMFGLRFFW